VGKYFPLAFGKKKYSSGNCSFHYTKYMVYTLLAQSSKVTAKASRASLNVIWRAREQQGPQLKEICYLQQ
jgi:hypothetical protein